MAPICPHFGVCGGCSLQDQPYTDQLKTKENWVREALANLTVQQFHRIGPSPEEIFYRNKMEYSFGDEKDIEILNRPWKESKQGVGARRCLAQIGKTLFLQPNGTLGDPPGRPYNGKNQIHLGLHPKKRWSLVVPTPECQLQSKESQAILKIISAWATQKKIPAYLKKNHTGILRHLVIREGKNTRERMVNLFTTSNLGNIDDLAALLKDPSLGISTFIWTTNDEKSDATQGKIKNVFWGEGKITEKSGSVILNVAPTAFLQTNTHAFEKMLAQLKSWISVEPKQTHLYDLYCGCGTIGLELAPQFETVLGIEQNARAIDEANLNAEKNGIQNAKFISGMVENHLNELGNPKSTIVVDPPRNGLHKRVTEALLRLSAPIIYYVSCNREALARDLQMLQAKYRISDVQPFDFFPHTDHVETLVKLKNND